jgi:hypothetical protein
LPFSGVGAGTSASPYQITTLAQLNEVRDYPSAYWILMNDIDASATSGWNSGAGWIPIPNFAGSFNGNSKKIDGLYQNRAGIGFFATMTNTFIGVKNLALTNINLTHLAGNNYVGALAQTIGTSTVSMTGIIEKCYITGTIHLNGTFNYGGGFAGRIYGGIIRNCFTDVLLDYITGTINYYLMGFAQTEDYVNISNCYSKSSTDQPTAAKNHGFGRGYGTYTNCYWDNQQTGFPTSEKGTGLTMAQAKTQASYVSWDFLNIWAINADSYPRLRCYYLGSGAGTAADPYQITTLAELNEVRANLASYWKLMNDIDASSTTSWTSSTGEGWVPIGDSTNGFSGYFDGNNKKITGLYSFQVSGSSIGFIGITTGGASTIVNLGLVDIYFGLSDPTYAGGLVGYAFGTSLTISNCYVTGSIYGPEVFGTTVGGLVGRFNSVGNVTNCWTNVDINVSTAFGNIAGFATAAAVAQTYTNCFSIGPLIGGGATVHGFAYGNNTTANSCYWDFEASGVSTSNKGTSKTTAQMKNQETFIGWNFIDIWAISPGQYPRLKAFDSVGTHPVITILSITTTDATPTEASYKVSKIAGEMGCTLVFQTSENIQAWQVELGGVGPGGGILLASGGAVNSNTDITANFDSSLLSGPDGAYQINIYAQNLSGIWTPYMET